MMPSKKIKKNSQFFNDLVVHFNRKDYLSSDPVQFVHRYIQPEDQEVVGFLAACFSYGSVLLIKRALEAILKPMGASPYQFIKQYDGERYWPGFCHRFHKEDHVLVLMMCLKKAIHTYGSLENLFCSSEAAFDLEFRMHAFAQWFLSAAEEVIEQNKMPVNTRRGIRFLFNSPYTNSACKRLTMFLRWMVRKDEIDIGLWKSVKPSDLVIPVDTHVARLSYLLGLRQGHEGQAGSWKMAREITESLKKMNPDDPVAYDFAMTRLGILDIL